jgi:NTE family protein
MRVGLVLGAGGVMGGAWLTGALQAIASETGWDPGSADHVVGTSAGSMIGALIASGVPPWFMVAHSAGEVFEGLDDASGRPAGEADRSAGARFRLHPGLPSLAPGSWRLAVSALTRPTRHTPAAFFAGWLPVGMVSTESLKDTVRRVVPNGWAPHPNLWIMACDYTSGRRVAFGREDAPEADLAEAVAASCAIPGFYRASTIGGRRYVDGGVYSASNLDVLRSAGLDVVICLNPSSSLDRGRGGSPVERVAAAVRTASGRRLGHEARTVRAAGTQVVLIQPTAEDLLTMGPNPMSGRRRERVIDVAMRTVAEQLRDPRHGPVLERLPTGAPFFVSRPSDAPSAWPPFEQAAAARWAAGGAASSN